MMSGPTTRERESERERKREREHAQISGREKFII